MKRRNRFWPLWLLPGIPVVTLAWHYRLDSEPAVVQQTRRELATQASRVNQAMGTTRGRNPRELHEIFQSFVESDSERIVWIQFRDGGGALRGFAGTPAGSAFTMEFVRAQFRRHRPIYKLIHTRQGAVLVEAFPVRAAADEASIPLHRVADGAADPALSGVIEIATLLSRPAPMRGQTCRVACNAI
jgi:hypothetical protein